MLEVDIEGRAGDFTLAAAFTAGAGATALIGPSGAGKTSLLRMIAGL
ncbi:MAG TPA: ATP-binding cassette domain-containing protein, partial [Devosiaceae bacterium]|nr:ATP-binding cassette domain-containing protein [Devosiaceae bacterium]